MDLFGVYNHDFWAKIGAILLKRHIVRSINYFPLRLRLSGGWIGRKARPMLALISSMVMMKPFICIATLGG